MGRYGGLGRRSLRALALVLGGSGSGAGVSCVGGTLEGFAASGGPSAITLLLLGRLLSSAALDSLGLRFTGAGTPNFHKFNNKLCR